MLSLTAKEFSCEHIFCAYKISDCVDLLLNKEFKGKFYPVIGCE
jgi:hypothetical protein